MFLNCKEEIELENFAFEEALVVEGTITNIEEFQTIKLSKTVPLETDDIPYLNNATVKVNASNGEVYNFTQNQEGIYISDQEFQAIPNVIYNLNINTENGEEYQSFDVQLTDPSEILNLYAEVDEDNSNINILIDSYGNNGNSQYFKYSFEETYKVVAPFYYYQDAIVENLEYDENGELSYDIIIQPREQEEENCFTSNYSNSLLITSTTNLDNNTVNRFKIHQIPTESYKILNRYSINVKQQTLSLSAYTFYKALQELGSNGSILSQSQPGFIAGNIINTTNPDKKVLGYFDIGHISQQRIYFNYSDFNLEVPNYVYDCDIKTLDYSDNAGTQLDGDANERILLYNYLGSRQFKLLEYTGGTIYTIVNPECGDCTSISSNIQPEFWEE